MDATQRQFCRSLRQLMARYPTAEAAREARRKAERATPAEEVDRGRVAARKEALA